MRDKHSCKYPTFAWHHHPYPHALTTQQYSSSSLYLLIPSSSFLLPPPYLIVLILCVSQWSVILKHDCPMMSWCSFTSAKHDYLSLLQYGSHHPPFIPVTFIHAYTIYWQESIMTFAIFAIAFTPSHSLNSLSFYPYWSPNLYYAGVLIGHDYWPTLPQFNHNLDDSFGDILEA